MTRLFLDTTVLALAAGDDHPLRDACRGLVARSARGETALHISAEAIQELLFDRMRRTGRTVAVEQTRAVREACVVHPVDLETLDRMLDLVETTQLRGRDAVHAATALVAGFTEIVSTDSDFDGIPGLARVSPEDL